MTFQLTNLIIATSLYLILFVAASRKKVWDTSFKAAYRLFMAGTALMLGGGALDAANNTGLLRRIEFITIDPTTLSILIEYLGTVGGLGLIALGVLIGSVSAYLNNPFKSMGSPKMPNEAQTSQELLRCTLESSISGTLILKAIRDKARKIVDFECRLMNKAAEQLLGQSARRVVGRPIRDKLTWIQNIGILHDAISVIETGLPFRDQRYCAEGKSWYQFTVEKFGDGVSITIYDMSDQKQVEQRLRHAAEHDALTGLGNRKLFSAHLEQAIFRAQRYDNYKFAVLFLDFDRFKIINDSLGHDVGDELLISISHRLVENLRAVDTKSRNKGEGHLPARLGGDEFVVLLDGITGIQDAVAVADRLLGEFLRPHMLDGHEVISTASIGVVTNESGYDNPDDMLRDADTAMYEAKNSGKARYVIFDDRMHKDVVDRLNMERELREAVHSRAFSIAYEPIVDVKDNRIAGFEALVRWPHPTRGMILPGKFIGLAEELGLIGTIGHWVLVESCWQLKKWQQQYNFGRSMFVSVNLSRAQLRDPEIVSTMKRSIADTGIDPGCVQLEITESMIMDDLDETQTVLNELKALGVRLAMDDFGTGHSSLNCLHHLPLDVLKIDRSITNDVEKDMAQHQAIMKAIMDLAHNLKMNVIAEGVEKKSQLELLKQLTCDYGQGWLFTKPINAAAVEKILDKTEKRHTAAA